MAKKPRSNPRLRRTDDYPSMIQLGQRSGLEGETLQDVSVAYGYFLGEELIACAALKVQNGVFVVECLAVDGNHRGKGLGSKLLKRIENEARRRGATRIWALARQPGFFGKMGYSQMERSEPGAPSIESCLKCHQYGRTCSPATMVRNLAARPRPGYPATP